MVNICFSVRCPDRTATMAWRLRQPVVGRDGRDDRCDGRATARQMSRSTWRSTINHRHSRGQNTDVRGRNRQSVCLLNTCV